MGSVAWLGTMVAAGIAQEAPAVPPPRGVVIDDREQCLDLSAWWSRNEARFLTNGPRRQPPDAARVAQRIVPTLRKALDSDSPDLIGAGLMALARIGHEIPEARLAEDFARHLHHRDQAVRETAALALGVAGIDTDRERDLLVRLARGDGEPGTTDGVAPTLRTRVFATYGLGLLANGSNRLATKRTAFQVMQWLLRMEHRGADLPVAAVHALAELHLDGGDEAAAELQKQVLELLTETWADRHDQPDDLVACACPPAIGKLLGRGHPRSGELIARFVQQLGRNLPTELGKPSVTQSCAIALGLLAQPDDATVVEALAVAAARALASLGEEGLGAELIRGALASPNHLANQCCSLLAAGEMAAEADVDALLQALTDARRSPLSRAFAAIALGTAARRATASWSFSLGQHTNPLAAPATLSNNSTGVLDLQ